MGNQTAAQLYGLEDLVQGRTGNGFRTLHFRFWAAVLSQSFAVAL